MPAFACNNCNTTFTTAYLYNKHITRKNPCVANINTTPSVSIPSVTPELIKATETIKIVIPSNDKVFQCENCKKVYKTKLVYSKHLKSCNTTIKSLTDSPNEISSNDTQLSDDPSTIIMNSLRDISTEITTTTTNINNELTQIKESLTQNDNITSIPVSSSIPDVSIRDYNKYKEYICKKCKVSFNEFGKYETHNHICNAPVVIPTNTPQIGISYGNINIINEINMIKKQLEDVLTRVTKLEVFNLN